MHRRDFIRTGTVAAAGFTILPSGAVFGRAAEKVKLGYIGVGERGRNHINEGLLRDDVEIVAICDIAEDSLKSTRAMFTKAGKKLPKEYTGGVDAYKELLNRKDIQGVIISTPWEYHKDQSIDAMKAGKYVGCEVIAGITLDDHWDIVKTSEQTGMPYMTLENVCYRRDVMAVLNMVRQNLFGEIIHLEGGYQHDLRGVLFNDGKSPYGKGAKYGKDGYSEARWRTEWNMKRNGDLYPTHGAGPVMHYADINYGNRFTNLVSFGSKSRGLQDYVKSIDPNNPVVKADVKNSDVSTTVLNCANGETVVISHDVHLPRPYSLGFRVQGTQGIWMDVNDSIYIEGKSEKHDVWDKADIWLEKYDHPLWKKYAAKAEGAGHGGMDWFVFNAFVESVKRKKQTPIDVYDSVTMSAITPLSETSVQNGNAPQEFPDFTGGKWKDRKTTFALNDDY
ncbi:MAG: Gfo/Idh/MocA family oxidoreductase [Mucilaginibacter polytrichastri]|nr:Gfo/Idh/MocA family oxidoreductase [Mucilaginibacter polytrichastri]